MAAQRIRGVGLGLVAVAILASGCVFTPSAPKKPTTATIGQVQLVVPKLDGATNSQVEPWHVVRLTLGREDGSVSDISRTIKGRKGQLQAPTAIKDLPIGVGVWGRVELVQETGVDSERVVGRGYLAEGTAKLVGGRNDLRFLVGPTAAGGLLATSPSVSREERREAEEDEEEGSSGGVRDAGSDLVGAILVGAAGAILSGGSSGSNGGGSSGGSSGSNALAEGPSPKPSSSPDNGGAIILGGKKSGGLILLNFPE